MRNFFVGDFKKYALLFVALLLCSCGLEGDRMELHFEQKGSASFAQVNIKIENLFNSVCFLEGDQSTDEIRSSIVVTLIDTNNRKWQSTGNFRMLGREDSVTCYDFIENPHEMNLVIKKIQVSHKPEISIPRAYWLGYDK